jgi:hypothetical protein
MDIYAGDLGVLLIIILIVTYLMWDRLFGE